MHLLGHCHEQEIQKAMLLGQESASNRPSMVSVNDLIWSVCIQSETNDTVSSFHKSTDLHFTQHQPAEDADTLNKHYP